jgi:bifunctional DNase/RNase
VVKPADYVQVRVAQVVPHGDGGAVLLLDETSNRVLPIYIGGSEAASIDYRLRNEVPPRPLTHDLLDTAVRKLGGEIVKVHVDALRAGVFHGSVYIRKGRHVLRLDSRSSDAIALAIGNSVPIYVALRVLDEAGVDPASLSGQPAP